MNKRKKATSTAAARRPAKSGAGSRATARAAARTQARTAARGGTGTEGPGSLQRALEAVSASPHLGKRTSRSVKPSTTLALAAECLVTDASSLKASLAALLEEPQPVTLDITALQRVDTAGLQVITAFVRERARHARQVEWQGSAQVLAAAAQLLGLTSFLKLPA